MATRRPSPPPSRPPVSMATRRPISSASPLSIPPPPPAARLPRVLSANEISRPPSRLPAANQKPKPPLLLPPPPRTRRPQPIRRRRPLPPAPLLVCGPCLCLPRDRKWRGSEGGGGGRGGAETGTGACQRVKAGNLSGPEPERAGLRQEVRELVNRKAITKPEVSRKQKHWK